MKKFIFSIFIIILFATGCGNGSSASNDGTINYMTAKEKIINDGAILLDVRTQEEYDDKHIDGSLLLPLDSIDEDSIKDVVDDLNDVVIVYCASGNRSHQAYLKLKSLGYTEVYDLGSINNWKE